MRYTKSITQRKLGLLLATYTGLLTNGAVSYRHFGSYTRDFAVWKDASAAVELATTILTTFSLLHLLPLFDRRSWRILTSLMVPFSAGVSYYMIFLSAVIGCGIITSVMTTDIDLSEEAAGPSSIF